MTSGVDFPTQTILTCSLSGRENRLRQVCSCL